MLGFGLAIIRQGVSLSLEALVKIHLAKQSFNPANLVGSLAGPAMVGA